MHISERAVIYYNALTGERRVPARADEVMPQVYASQGFERQEIMNMSAYEKQTGSVHEPSNFNPGNEVMPQETMPTGAPPQLKQELINDMREAIASGPWTGQDNLL